MDPIKGVSESIIVGRHMPLGTGVVELRMKSAENSVLHICARHQGWGQFVFELCARVGFLRSLDWVVVDNVEMCENLLLEALDWVVVDNVELCTRVGFEVARLVVVDNVELCTRVGFLKSLDWVVVDNVECVRELAS